MPNELEDQRPREITRELFNEYDRQLTAYVKTYVSDRHYAEEIRQESWTIFIHNWKDFRTYGSPVAPLINVAKFSILKSYSKRKKGEEQLDHDPVTYSEYTYVEARIDLTHAILTLPLQQREVAELHFLVGLDIPTIAELIGIKEDSVRRSLARSRKKLQESPELSGYRNPPTSHKEAPN